MTTCELIFLVSAATKVGCMQPRQTVAAFNQRSVQFYQLLRTGDIDVFFFPNKECHAY